MTEVTEIGKEALNCGKYDDLLAPPQLFHQFPEVRLPWIEHRCQTQVGQRIPTDGGKSEHPHPPLPASPCRLLRHILSGQ